MTGAKLLTAKVKLLLFFWTYVKHLIQYHIYHYFDFFTRSKLINSYLLKWIKSYLLKREQFVVVNGQASTTLQAMSGVPQGSVLGPLLFIMYINNVSDVVSSDTHLNMFADDMAIYRVIKSSKTYDTLQEDIKQCCCFHALVVAFFVTPLVSNGDSYH